MYPIPITFVLFNLALAGAASAADLTSPVGTWRTIDEQSGKPKSVVQISEDHGQLTGKILKLLEGAAQQNCSKCEGELQDKPLVGMKILWGLKPDGNEWTGGKIFNPSDGGTYTSKLKLLNGGKTLEVTGKWMLFSKQQRWERIE